MTKPLGNNVKYQTPKFKSMTNAKDQSSKECQITKLKLQGI